MKITGVISIGDEDGVYIFDDSTLYFWTSGRGGFGADGCIGIWPPGPDHRDRIDAIDQYLFDHVENIEQAPIHHIDRWLDLDPMLLGKAVQADQFTRPSKYSLIGILVDEIYTKVDHEHEG